MESRRDFDQGPSHLDRIEVKEERKKAADDKRERDRRNDEQRRIIESKRIEIALASANIVACQKQLASIAEMLPSYSGPTDHYIPSQVSEIAQKMGRDQLGKDALTIGETQAYHEAKLKDSVDYVCRHDVSIRSSLEAELRKKEIRKEGFKEIDRIAWQTLNGILLGVLTGVMPRSMREATVGATLGGNPSLGLEDIVMELVGAANKGAGMALTALWGPVKMGATYGCLAAAIAEVEKRAAEAKVREEAARMKKAIEDSTKNVRDYKWDRDPGWLDFIGRHSNIA